jgi:acyl carrier protein
MSSANGEVLERVIDCIAATTRYPRQVLLPDSDLENDLGIDSVKRVEIVAALGNEFELDLISQARDPSIRTIRHVSNWIENSLGGKSTATHPDTSSNGVTNVHVQNLAIQESSFPKQPAAYVPPTTAPHTKETGRIDFVNGAHAIPPSPKSTEFQPSLNGSVQTGNLQGRVALVTGSGRGVGRTIARVLAARGATVIVNSFHSRELGEQTTAEINAHGGKAVHIWGSVANPAHVDNMFDEIERQFGQLDILVCNASDGKIGSFTDVTADDWDRAFRTNVTGHHQCAMRASRLMQRHGGGAIITMSSVAASRYVEGLGGQGVVKAAVESLTRYLACELAPFGIRANCVSGGPVYGQVMSMYPDARATLNYWETLVLDGELCSPLDLANTVAYLVSDDARGVNGAVWRVDHGLSTRSHSRPLPRPAANVQQAPTYSSR